MRLIKTLYSFGLTAVLAANLTLATSCAAEPDHGKAMLERIPHFKKFIAAKEKQARAETEAANQTVAPEMWQFFELARTGQWNKATNLWSSLAKRSGQYEGTKWDYTVRTAAWSPALEVVLVLEAFASGNYKYPEAFGRGIVKSIPRGAIFFGGTDPGRGLPTCFSESHADGDPFFTLTQNALADGTYLEYLRRMYGKKIYTPTQSDSQKAFQEYLADAQRRLEHDRKFPNEAKHLKPGEDVKMIDNRVQVSGQVAVMAINGLLAKMIFDQNPEREFYIEESFPLDWMYPHLSPHGLIMKLNRIPVECLSEECVEADHKFWSEQVKNMLGNWLTDDTSVQELCAFVQTVFVEKDLKQFKGDPLFVKHDDACKEFSKLRSSIAGLYSWRVNNTKDPEERARMVKAADLAFRQAFAMCPYSPEAVFRYVNFLVDQDRKEDALALVESAQKVDPGNRQLTDLQRQIKIGKVGKRER